MKPAFLALLLGTTTLPAGTLILSDNFNAPDNANFDNSDQTGRRAGLLAPEVQLRSSRIQHGIVSNQLNFLPHPTTGSGRIRFQQVASLPVNVWTDFASGAAGTTILAEGGLKITFDWIPGDTTNANWISFNAGIAGIAVAEPGSRVNHAGTDFGILFRNNGATQRFLNGAGTVGGSFPVPSVATRKVVITLAFDSFADGSLVMAKATVDGISVLPDGFAFQWNGNNGIQNMELGNLAAGTRIDNVAISGLNGLSINMSAQPFYSSIANGGLVASFTSEDGELPEPATYTLVAGTGDTDNAKFKITGDRLESNGFNFQDVPEGTPLSVRIRSTATSSGLSVEQVFPLSIVTDSDSDDLPDSWELAVTGNVGPANLADLKGRNPAAGPGAGTGNFDGDTLTDLQEFQLTRGLFPLLSPLLADTDGDGLEDGSEITPTAPRLATNPTIADTDGDGLSDLVENNSGTFVSATNPGTSPVDYDSDDDNFPDGYEITRGTNPLDSSSAQVPTLPSPLTALVLTTDETSGIEASKTYTHAISGGYATSINGVAFTALKPTETPVDFVWLATNSVGNAATFNEIAVSNLGGWLPANGNVTGTGLLELLGGFTFSSNGDRPRSFQTYTLTGLTPGQKYEVKLYTRVWSKVASGRPISLTFANGSQTVNAYIHQDRPVFTLGDGLEDTAYALAFPYTAETTELLITAAVPLTTVPVSGSWHLYGLTNEVVPAASDTSFAITSLSVQQTPTRLAAITFNSVPGAVYAVDYSTSLNAAGQPGGWITLASNLTAQSGLTTYNDTVAVGTGSRIFYRVRRTGGVGVGQ